LSDVQGANEDRGQVVGRALSPSGEPLAGVRLELRLAGLRTDSEPLAVITTTEDGSYAINYDRKVGGATGPPDLVVVATDGSRELGRSQTAFRAGSAAELDLSITLAPDTSRWTILEHQIPLVLAGQDDGGAYLDPARLGPADLKWIAESQKLDPAETADWVAAHEAARPATDGVSGLQQSDKVESVAFFAWARAGLPRSPEEVLAVPVDQLLGVLDAAADAGVIPKFDKDWRERIEELVDEHQLEVEFKKPPGPRVASLRGVLGALPKELAVSDRRRRGLAEAQRAHPTRDAAFWSRVEEIGLSKPQIAAFRGAVALGDLCAGNEPLLTAIAARLPQAPDSELTVLAELPTSDWVAAVAQVEPDQPLHVIEATAAALADDAARLHPSRTFAFRLAAGELAAVRLEPQRLSTFLDGHPQFDLIATDVEPYLTGANIEDGELRDQLLAVQRPLRLGATQPEAVALVDAGLDSAQKIQRAGVGRVERALGQSSTSAQAQMIVKRASQAKTIAREIGLRLIAEDRATTGGAGASAAGARAVSRFPSLQTLFGPEAACACGRCSSIASPASYLVDQLRTAATVGSGEGLEVLAARRLDILHTELTCPNTNRPVPYAALVTEVLENAVVFPLGPLALDAPNQQQWASGVLPEAVRELLAPTVDAFGPSVTVEELPIASQDETERRFALRDGHLRWIGSRGRARLALTLNGFEAPVPAALAQRLAAMFASMAQLEPVDGLERDRLRERDLVRLLAQSRRLPVVGHLTVVEVPRSYPSQGLRITGRRQVVVGVVSHAANPGHGPQISESVGFYTFTSVGGAPLGDAPSEYPAQARSSLDSGEVPFELRLLLAQSLETMRQELSVERTANNRWTITAEVDARLTYSPDQVRIDAMVHSESDGDLQPRAAAPHRIPLAYARLRQAKYPWTQPYDDTLTTLRCCLEARGTTRQAVVRTVAPNRRRASVADAAERLKLAPAQLSLLQAAGDEDARAARWGLAPTGNTLTDPGGSDRPVPASWVPALGLLSVLLNRSAVDLPTLLDGLAARCVVGGGPAPACVPPDGCNPSEINVTGLTGALLDRLQGLLRLVTATGWSVRDADAVVSSATAGQGFPLTAEQTIAVASIAELAERLSVSLSQAAALVGQMETAGVIDHHAHGTPTRPSLYASVYLSPDLGGGTSPFTLVADGSELVAAATGPGAPTVRTHLARAAQALRVAPAALARLLAPVSPPARELPGIGDELRRSTLVDAWRHTTVARALGLSVDDHQRLAALAGASAPIPPTGAGVPVAVRIERLFAYADLTETVRRTGLDADDLAALIAPAGGATFASSALADSRRVERRTWLLQLQQLLGVERSASDGSVDASSLREQLMSAGWRAGAVDRLLAEGTSPFGLGSTVNPPGEPAIDVDAAVTELSRWLRSVELPESRASLQFVVDGPVGAVATPWPAGLGARATRDAMAGTITFRGFPTSGDRRLLGRWFADASAELGVGVFSPAPLVTEIAGLLCPPSLMDPGARLRYDAATGELVLSGFLDPVERVALSARVARPEFAAAITVAATRAEASSETRAPYLLLDAAAVRALVDEPEVGRRYLAVSRALVGPLRRARVLRAIAERAGLEAALVEALDDIALAATPPVDVLGPLTTDAFLSADLTRIDRHDPWDISAQRIDRSAAFVSSCGLRGGQNDWLRAAANGGLAGLDEAWLVPPTRDIGARLDAWRRGIELARLRSVVPGGTDTLDAIRLASVAADPGDALSTGLSLLAKAYGLPDAGALRLDGSVSDPAQLRDPFVLAQLDALARLQRRLRTTGSVLRSLGAAEPTEADARSARELLAEAQADSPDDEGLQAAMRSLIDARREALVGFLIQRDHLVDSADLHERYLLDVEMGPDQLSSRIKQAIGSVQLLFQRALMGEEPSMAPPGTDTSALHSPLLGSHQVREANLDVMRFPHHWLDPTLRDDKTHLFRQLESELLQSEPTPQRAVDAMIRYTERLQEMGRVSVLAMHVDDSGLVHIVGRSTGRPASYYYRQWSPPGADNRFEPWEPLEAITGTVDHVTVFRADGIVRVAWLEIGEGAREAAPEDAQSAAAWSLRLKWSQRGADGWSAPLQSSDALSWPKTPRKSPAQSFALRVEPDGERGQVVRCFAWNTKERDAPEPPPKYPADGATVLSPLVANWTGPAPRTISVQVLGYVDGSRSALFPVPGARVSLWASATGTIGTLQFDGSLWATADQPTSVRTEADGVAAFYQSTPVLPQGPAIDLEITVHCRVDLPGAKDDPHEQSFKFAWTGADNAPVSSVSKLGFQLDVSAVRGAPTAAADPDRRLDLYPVATARWSADRTLEWVRGLGGAALPLADGAEHWCSAQRFRADTLVTARARVLIPKAPAPVVACVASAQKPVAASGGNLVVPVYVELADGGESGFVVDADPLSHRLRYLPATDAVAAPLRRALRGPADAPVLTLSPDTSGAFPLAAALQARLDQGTSPGAPQFDEGLPLANYHSELGLHAPMLIQDVFARHDRHTEALTWLRLVLDPTAGDSAHWWRYPPFAAHGRGTPIAKLLEDWTAGRDTPQQHHAVDRMIAYSRAWPFRPFALARMRVRPFMEHAALRYAELLLLRGEQRLRRDTIEWINLGTHDIVLAGELLGPPPEVMPERERSGRPPTFAAVEHWDATANAWDVLIDSGLPSAIVARSQTTGPPTAPTLDDIIGVRSPGTAPGLDAVASAHASLESLGSLVFCIGRDERIDAYRERVADLLFKVRHNQNIDGVTRQLALWEPPIDPALLVRAAAAGLDLGTVLDESFALAVPYRFPVPLARAKALCAEDRALTAALMAAREKGDVEALTRLRSTQEISILEMVRDTRQRRIDEAEEQLANARRARGAAELRFRHFQRLLGKEQVTLPAVGEASPQESSRLRLAGQNAPDLDPDLRGYGLTTEESDQLSLLKQASVYADIASIHQIGSGVAHALPNQTFPTGQTWGGSHLGSAIGAVGSVFSMVSAKAAYLSNRASIVGSHQRRYDEWVFASNEAGRGIEQADGNILGAEIRLDLARRELAQHERQIANARELETYQREKFSSVELYAWMDRQLAQTHRALFELAHREARRAERCLMRKHAVDFAPVIRNTWDDQHGGLLASEQLTLDLARLEALDLELPPWELEITKNVPLSQIDPLALLSLRMTGRCEFELSELLFDLDRPGDYLRRLRTVSVSVMCVASAHAGVPGTLTLLRNETRARPVPPPVASDPTNPPVDPAIEVGLVPIQSIATSSGREDSGLFQLDFRDERILPFELGGAHSKWRFELPSQYRPFDYGTISDLVLHVRYTARHSSSLETSARARVTAALQAADATQRSLGRSGRLARTFSLRHDFPSEWSRLQQASAGPQVLRIGRDRFPVALRESSIKLWRVALHVPGAEAGDPAPFTLTPPDAAYTGADDVTPALDLGDQTVDGVPLHVAELDVPDFQVLTMPSDSPELEWTLERVAGEPMPNDVVVALWWRLD
jgi:Tc toxin complex TcA C-terminal TcB-binding domain/Neuraminidase-like domain